jgi:hypothetical protein
MTAMAIACLTCLALVALYVALDVFAAVMLRRRAGEWNGP